MTDDHNEPRVHDYWFLDLDFLLYAPLVDHARVREAQKLARLGRMYGASDKTIHDNVVKTLNRPLSEAEHQAILAANPWIKRALEEKKHRERMTELSPIAPVVFEGVAGANILAAAEAVVAHAKKNGRVHLRFNGTEVLVTPRDDASDVVARYQAQRGEHEA